MESGWAKFKALYDYKPTDDREIPIEQYDILVVPKPYGDPKSWLVGRNERTGQHGVFPGTYVEHIGDIDDIKDANEEPEPEPVRPPPIPPRIQRPNQMQGKLCVTSKYKNL
jgi:hypothetical protein